MFLFQAEGHASQCYPSPTVWVAQGTTVVDLLCVEPLWEGSGGLHRALEGAAPVALW